MSKKKKKNGPKKPNQDTQYAHNPNYCMILPDATNEGKEEDIVSTGQS